MRAFCQRIGLTLLIILGFCPSLFAETSTESVPADDLWACRAVSEFLCGTQSFYDLDQTDQKNLYNCLNIHAATTSYTFPLATFCEDAYDGVQYTLVGNLLGQATELNVLRYVESGTTAYTQPFSFALDGLSLSDFGWSEASEDRILDSWYELVDYTTRHAYVDLLYDAMLAFKEEDATQSTDTDLSVAEKLAPIVLPGSAYTQAMLSLLPVLYDDFANHDPMPYEFNGVTYNTTRSLLPLGLGLGQELMSGLTEGCELQVNDPTASNDYDAAADNDSYFNPYRCNPYNHFSNTLRALFVEPVSGSSTDPYSAYYGYFAGIPSETSSSSYWVDDLYDGTKSAFATTDAVLAKYKEITGAENPKDEDGLVCTFSVDNPIKPYRIPASLINASNALKSFAESYDSLALSLVQYFCVPCEATGSCETDKNGDGWVCGPQYEYDTFFERARIAAHDILLNPDNPGSIHTPVGWGMRYEAMSEPNDNGTPDDPADDTTDIVSDRFFSADNLETAVLTLKEGLTYIVSNDLYEVAKNISGEEREMAATATTADCAYATLPDGNANPAYAVLSKIVYDIDEDKEKDSLFKVMRDFFDFDGGDTDFSRYGYDSDTNTYNSDNAMKRLISHLDSKIVMCGDPDVAPLLPASFCNLLWNDNKPVAESTAMKDKYGYYNCWHPDEESSGEDYYVPHGCYTYMYADLSNLLKSPSVSRAYYPLIQAMNTMFYGLDVDNDDDPSNDEALYICKVAQLYDTYWRRPKTEETDAPSSGSVTLPGTTITVSYVINTDGTLTVTVDGINDEHDVDQNDSTTSITIVGLPATAFNAFARLADLLQSFEGSQMYDLIEGILSILYEDTADNTGRESDEPYPWQATSDLHSTINGIRALTRLDGDTCTITEPPQDPEPRPEPQGDDDGSDTGDGGSGDDGSGDDGDPIPLPDDDEGGIDGDGYRTTSQAGTCLGNPIKMLLPAVYRLLDPQQPTTQVKETLLQWSSALGDCTNPVTRGFSEVLDANEFVKYYSYLTGTPTSTTEEDDLSLYEKTLVSVDLFLDMEKTEGLYRAVLALRDNAYLHYLFRRTDVEGNFLDSPMEWIQTKLINSRLLTLVNDMLEVTFDNAVYPAIETDLNKEGYTSILYVPFDELVEARIEAWWDQSCWNPDNVVTSIEQCVMVQCAQMGAYDVTECVEEAIDYLNYCIASQGFDPICLDALGDVFQQRSGEPLAGPGPFAFQGDPLVINDDPATSPISIRDPNARYMSEADMMAAQAEELKRVRASEAEKAELDKKSSAEIREIKAARRRAREENKENPLPAQESAEPIAPITSTYTAPLSTSTTTTTPTTTTSTTPLIKR